MTEEREFVPWPKIARLNRDIVITEKIDGTNAAVIITNAGDIYAQSRTRIITPGDDNFGFAKWVETNKDTLVEDLGPGRHFGEWWGSGIQRGYDLPKGMKCFSLFNSAKWAGESTVHTGPDPKAPMREWKTELMFVVPVLYRGLFSQLAVEMSCDILRDLGSFASHRFPKPEGVVVFHTASREMYKVLLENDEIPKGLVK